MSYVYAYLRKSDNTPYYKGKGNAMRVWLSIIANLEKCQLKKCCILVFFNPNSMHRITRIKSKGAVVFSLHIFLHPFFKISSIVGVNPTMPADKLFGKFFLGSTRLPEYIRNISPSVFITPVINSHTPINLLIIRYSSQACFKAGCFSNCSSVSARSFG